YGDSEFKGDISKNHSAITFFKGATSLNGAGAQSLEGSVYFDFDDLVINKPSDHVTANIPVEIKGILNLTSGNLVTDSINLLTMTAGSSVINASNNSFVEGPTKKIGSTMFVFPVGKGEKYNPIEITAPSNITDAFLAEYFNEEQDLGEEMDATIDFLSQCNYWKLNRTNGISNVDVYLSWQQETCTILDSADLRVAGWNDSIWNDLGITNFTGTMTGGKIKNNLSISNYSYFALAYATTVKPYVTLGPDSAVSTGSFNYANVQYSGNLRWFPKAGLSCYECPYPDISLNSSRLYYLSATDYKGRSAKDSVIFRIHSSGNLAASMYPPAVDWKNVSWAGFNPFTSTTQNQVDSGDEWWYGHSNSYLTPGMPEMDGYICAGYGTYVNQGINEIPLGGCANYEVVLGDPECGAFETATTERGELFAKMSLRDLQGKRIWYKRFAMGQFYMTKQTSDGGYMAVGLAKSTIIPFVTPMEKLYYNFTTGGTNDNICNYGSETNYHAYAVKVDKDGILEWQRVYGEVALNNNSKNFSSELYNFIEIDNGYRLVGRAESPNTNLSTGNAWILDINLDGDYLNSYLMPESFSGGATGFDEEKFSLATDIIRYFDGTNFVNIISGILHGNNYSSGTPARRVFLTNLQEQTIGNLDLNNNINWINTNSFDDNVNELNSTNYYVKVGKNTLSQDVILLPVVYGCTNCYFATDNNAGEGKVFQVDIFSGLVNSGATVSVGSVEAFDLKIDVVPTDDLGFAVLSTKKSPDPEIQANYSCNGGTYGLNNFSYWNTDAFVAKFSSTSTNPEWYIQFDTDYQPPVFYPGDYKKQECMYTITNAHDGGFVVAGNSSGNFDDYYLCKLQSDCITRNASFATITDASDLIYEIGDGTTPTSETWNSSQTVLGSVIVKNNAELIITGNSTLIEFADSRRVATNFGHNIISNLVVEPGGSLLIEDAASLDVITSNTSGSCTDGMWDGIQVLGNDNVSQSITNQGICQTNTGASISNARIGIIAGNANYDDNFDYLVSESPFDLSGGILRTFDTDFINNRESIWIAPYTFPSYSNVAISGNNFECNSALRDPFYKHDDLRPEGISSFVTMVFNKQIGLVGNTFTGNSLLDTDIRGTAIRCDECAAAIHQGNSFTDLTYGIKGQFVNFGGIKALQILNNDFVNVQAGINLLGNSFSRIIGNEFDIPFGMIPFKFTYGIWMDNSNGFTISDENIFRGINSGDNYGVIVTNSGIAGGDVFNNAFEFTETGFQTEFDNSILQIRCNDFQSHSNAWRINPAASPGALANQGTGCLLGQLRAANEFLDDNCASQQHILSSLGFTYFGPQSSVNPFPDPQVPCSDAPPVFIDYCNIQFPETSCDNDPPPGNDRNAWFELIENTEDSLSKQHLWQAFLREIIALDTLGQDSTIVTFFDSLNTDISKWYKVAWYFNKVDLNKADSLLSIIQLINFEDSSLYSYNNLILNILETEGNLLTLNEDRVAQLNEIRNLTPTVSKHASALLEMAGVEKFNYEPEQIPELRINNQNAIIAENNESYDPYILVYPNPSNGIFVFHLLNLQSSSETFTFEIYNNVGELLSYDTKISNSTNVEFNVDLTNFTSGFYYGKVSFSNKVLYEKLYYLE
ncbi:MAG: T9SS type A sorting domain-containing protein, partial [Nitrosopumilus sp.]|nr:T9SS type A sorting domain-containing protein [Nitrosopumilus sp.]